MDIQSPDVGPDRRMQTRMLVRNLVSERTEMLVLFCRAAGIDHLNVPGGSAGTVEEVVREFCQVLIDYVAAGHFTLYERVAKGQERRQSVKDMAARIYHDLEATTQAALDFNDAYQEAGAANDVAKLAEDLSSLGQQLAIRIELEDQLLLAIDPAIGVLR